MNPAPAHPADPSSYKRRVLFAICGLTPQVITESVYALAVTQQHPWIPTEVRLLTTSEGARRATLELLSDKPGWFHAMCAEYELPPILFSREQIQVIRDRTGGELADLREADDNQSAADAIIDAIRQLTCDPDCSLHVSLAGGRKTMGFYAGYALSLFGRSQDRLSHVLVPERYESSPHFFYPTNKPSVIYDRKNTPLDAAKGQVMLAEIPFVQMRHGLPVSLLEGSGSFSDVIAAANAALGPLELTIDLAGRRICAAGRWVTLTPASIAMYSLFARRAINGREPVPPPNKEVADATWGKCYRRELLLGVQHEDDIREETRKAFKTGMDGKQFSTCLSRLHKELRDALGPAWAAYRIKTNGRRPGFYALKIPAEAIRYMSG